MIRSRKITFPNRPLPVSEFQPTTWEDSRLLDIARHIGEQDMRFLMSVRDRHGLEVIEQAWVELRDAIAERRTIRSRPRFFNYLIKQHLNNQP